MEAVQGIKNEYGGGHSAPGAESTSVPCHVTQPVKLKLGLIAALLLTLFSTGCARLNLPAIDPDGSRIFLPFPNTTQLNVPRVLPRDGGLPTPAFQTPPTPPPCLDAGNGVCNFFGRDRKGLCDRLQECFDSPGKRGEIRLSPLRVAAPVGGEVVLLAGICGDQGYLVKRQPIEWMLSPDSVGTFIDVGDDRPGKLSNFLHMNEPEVEKLDVDFARGRTSTKPTVITRGTPSCNDDIALREGQTWLSISSPSQGVSRVTVMAPDSELWDRRRETATIYWVDAEWDFPRSPLPQPTGTPIELLTRVTKSESLVPAENWIVRYTILDPSIATFENGSGEAEVRVNRDGHAIVRLNSLPDGRGTTPVLIEVIKPAEPEENFPELTLGRGQTFVTYSAPGLALEVFGPDGDIGTVGEQLTYTAVVGNPGDLDAENVSLVFTKPADFRVVGSNYEPSQITNDQLRWDQGVLEANKQIEISVIVEPRQANTYELQFTAVAAGNLRDDKTLRARIIEPSLDVRFEPEGGIAQAEVGEAVKYEIDVTNTSRQTLNNLTIKIDSTPGLPELRGGDNSVEQSIDILQPGETRSIGISFRVQQQGQQSARLQVSLGEKLLAEKVAYVQGLPRRERVPDIGVSVEFPLDVSSRVRAENVTVGNTYLARVKLSNPGEVKLSNIQVALQFDPALTPIGADQVNVADFKYDALQPGFATWSANDLLPPIEGSGALVRELLVQFRVEQAIENGQISVRASADEGVSADASDSFRATQPVVPPTGGGANEIDNVQRTNTLKVSLEGFRNPATVGQQYDYVLNINNDRNVPDRDIQVLLRIPPELDLDEIVSFPDGDRISYQFTQQQSTIALSQAINFLRAGDSLTYTVKVTPRIPGTIQVQTQVTSRENPQAVNASASTTINPQ